MKIVSWLAHVFALAIACLREIFDESAYSRFLRRRQMPASSESYAEFCQEHAATKARRPRCC
jgi:hypothetical protein